MKQWPEKVECWECGEQRPHDGTACHICGASFMAPFEPSAIYLKDSNATEMALADVAMVWCSRGEVDFGYDMDGGALVAIRVNGDVTNLQTMRQR